MESRICYADHIVRNLLTEDKTRPGFEERNSTVGSRREIGLQLTSNELGEIGHNGAVANVGRQSFYGSLFRTSFSLFLSVSLSRARFSCLRFCLRLFFSLTFSSSSEDSSRVPDPNLRVSSMYIRKFRRISKVPLGRCQSATPYKSIIRFVAAS